MSNDNLNKVESDVKTDASKVASTVEADANSFFAKAFSGKVVAIVGGVALVVGFVLAHLL